MSRSGEEITGKSKKESKNEREGGKGDENRERKWQRDRKILSSDTTKQTGKSTFVQ